MPKQAHSLLRLYATLFDRPHLADRQTFEAVQDYLVSRNEGLMSFDDDSQKQEKKPSFDSSSGIGVLEIRGPLVYRESGWHALCGGASYEGILREAREMIEAGCKTIVMDADSGGGEAYGCFEAAEELRAMCDANGVRLHGYIDGRACSAMYAMIAVCDDVTINPYAEAGSIGVLIALHNDSERMKNEGVQRIFITDGSEKVPFDAEGNFREGFLADMQARVSELGDAFRAHVSKHTGMSVEDVKATNARVFSAKDALALGLVNQIMTRSEFVDFVVNKHKE